jgi:hypothetical protein
MSTSYHVLIFLLYGHIFIDFIENGLSYKSWFITYILLSRI